MIRQVEGGLKDNFPISFAKRLGWSESPLLTSGIEALHLQMLMFLSSTQSRNRLSAWLNGLLTIVYDLSNDTPFFEESLFIDTVSPLREEPSSRWLLFIKV